MGQGFSTIAWIPEAQGSWALPLMHEPITTRALDNETESFVLGNIDAVFCDRTVFMIAHRLSSVALADLIVVIENGNVLGRGTHEQLMAKKGLYYYLKTQQL